MFQPSTDVLLAAAAAAFTVDLLIYPLDTIKTRFQAPNWTSTYIHRGTSSINKTLLFRGLYQGVGSVVLATLPASGLFFTTYDATNHFLTTCVSSLPLPATHALSSSLAELISCLILTPAEVLKQNAQIVQPTPTTTTTQSTSSSIHTLLRFRTRPSRLFTGYTSLAARNLPFTAIQFPLYEALKVRFGGDEEATHGWAVTASAAATAGAVAAVLTTPVDVVKTRVMLRAGGGDSTAGGGEAGRGAWMVGREILARDGVRGLWRGGALRAVWTAMGSGLYLGTYEMGKLWLGERRNAEGSSVV